MKLDSSEFAVAVAPGVPKFTKPDLGSMRIAGALSQSRLRHALLHFFHESFGLLKARNINKGRAKICGIGTAAADLQELVVKLE